MTNDQCHPAQLDESTLLGGCELRRQRRSGPGGQHRNKVETGVVVTHLASGIRAEATERRSQEQNRREAVFRLRVSLAVGVRSELDSLPAGPSDLWLGRCQGGRLRVSPEHDDFPALLAEALDAVAARGFDVRAAAKWLGCSSSQLVKFLQLEPRAMELVNRQRREAGLRPFR